MLAGTGLRSVRAFNGLRNGAVNVSKVRLLDYQPRQPGFAPAEEAALAPDALEKNTNGIEE